MGKRLKRLTAGLLSALLLISVIPFVVATGALADWKSTRGNPQLKETADGEFCNFFVDSACTASTAEAHDMLSEAIVLRNLSLANGHWFYVGLSADAAEGWSFNDIAKGKLGFFVENTSDGIRFIFNANWQQILAVKKADTYTLRFVKDTDGTYGLQVNGTLAKHGDIDAYCKSGKTDSFVILTTSNWAKGDIRVGKLDWVESTSAVAVPSVSALVTGDTQVALSGGSVVTTTAKLDWNTQKLDVYKLVPSSASDRLCISLNKTAASTAFQPSAADGSVVSIALTPVDDQMEISLLGETETKLGAVPGGESGHAAAGAPDSGAHGSLAGRGHRLLLPLCHRGGGRAGGGAAALPALTDRLHEKTGDGLRRHRQSLLCRGGVVPGLPPVAVGRQFVVIERTFTHGNGKALLSGSFYEDFYRLCPQL